jgi:hypothetical protein
LAEGEAESENYDQALDEEQPRLVVGDGHFDFAVRVAMSFSGRDQK